MKSLEEREELYSSLEYFRKDLLKELSYLSLEYHITGMAYTICVADKPIQIECLGYLDEVGSYPIQKDSVFQIGSLSKSITSWGVITLLEDGLLDLETPANYYLSDWKLESDKYDCGKITVKMLLNHTSGLENQSYFGYEYGTERAFSINNLDKIKVIHEPGSMFLYSGSNYTVLQKIIESVSNCKFEYFMEDNVFNPLEMYKSSFYQKGYLLNNTGHGLLGERMGIRIFSEKAAAGCITTIKDISQFVKSNLEIYNGNRSESFKRLHTRTHRSVPYGFGFYCRKLAGQNIVYHYGINPGWFASLFLLPQIGIGVAVLTNSINGYHAANKINQFVLQKICGLLELKQWQILEFKSSYLEELITLYEKHEMRGITYARDYSK